MAKISRLLDTQPNGVQRLHSIMNVANSVGPDSVNNHDDVFLVQVLLHSASNFVKFLAKGDLPVITGTFDERTKNAIVAEFRNQLTPHEHLLDLALNEAEALAWQTSYPHLVFPTLAAEKAHALAEWQARQRSIQRRNDGLALVGR